MKNYFSATELENLHLTSLPSCKRLIMRLMHCTDLLNICQNR